MIYDFPEPSSPIGQGDIFFGVPILELPNDQLPLIGDDDTPRLLSWEDFSSAGERVSAMISVRPTVAIVGTQECDAIRASDITLFEVRPFRDVERKSKDTTKPAKWATLITQHARINQKWFYLPADETIGFTDKMAADFLTALAVPRLALERLINFRKGRLNEVARQHFRERLAEFFRRYAYDEWYPLTREELTEYQKNHPDAEPFHWQINEGFNQSPRTDTIEHIVTAQPSETFTDETGEKGFLDYLSGANVAMGILNGVLESINIATDTFNERIHKHNQEKEKIISEDDVGRAGKLENLYKRIAGDIHVLSKKIEDANSKWGRIVPELTSNVLGYIEWASLRKKEQEEKVANFRKQIEMLHQVSLDAKDTYLNLRDVATDLNRQNIALAFNIATRKQAKAYDDLVLNIEEVESFCLRTLFLMDERFKEGHSSSNSGE